MNNSRWQMSRIGLLDFWYYDEEEYSFLDGRMLLRGSNGSGKSVTMQSFIPVILDGNMRPERLDPFGSRARKMENYLLEEGDEREERTGYLYLELKRQESDVYLTIGIGMRARKNKKLDTWYFYIDDNRRMGKDLYLYKDVNAKIAYSKQELRNRIGEGGRVMESQSEYMEAVNRLVFGFETLDKYKEMLDLLIQLRSPKLSKDFKPTVLNEILSDSLLMLSEDDMRPMSEAIENMDALKTNLDALKESVRAAGQIARVYDRYNRIVLLGKAQRYEDSIQKWKKCDQAAREYDQKLEELSQECAALKETYERLDQEQRVLEQQKDSLNASDAVALKEQERQLTEDQRRKKQDIEQKEKQAQEKQLLCMSLERKIKDLQSKQEQLWGQVEGFLIQLQEIIEGIPFDEASFLDKELREAPEKSYDFAAHQRLLGDYRQKVKQGVNVLQEEKRRQDQLDHALRLLDEQQKEREKKDRERVQALKLLEEIRGELLEKCFQWAGRNEQLRMSEPSLQEISRMVNQYDERSDYGSIKEIARREAQRCEAPLMDRLREQKFLRDQNEERRNEKAAQIKAVEAQTGVRPEHSEEVERSRALLREQGIPYYCFYEVVDFDARLPKEQAARLEEALLQMGILDAVIISAEYRERVLTLREGVCDQYIFSDVSRVQENVMAALDVDNPNQDIFLHQMISRILCGIGFSQGGEGNTWVDGQGHYRLGVLEGTVTGVYEAQYIGTATRENARLKKLQQLRDELELLEAEDVHLREEQEHLEQQLAQLKKELDAFPSGEDVRTAATELGTAQRELKRLDDAVAAQRSRVETEENALREIRLQVQEICAKAYLTARLDIFQQAAETLEEYTGELGRLQMAHHEYRSSHEQELSQQDMLESASQTLDEILYDQKKYQREEFAISDRLRSVQEQLALSGLDEIQEQLDQCMKRLGEIPREREENVGRQRAAGTEQEQLRGLRQENEMTRVRLLQEMELWKGHFAREYALGYVERSFVITDDLEDQAQKVRKMLAGVFDGKSQADIFGEVQEAYHRERGVLLEYNLTMDYIFSEEGDTTARRIELTGKYRGVTVRFQELIAKLTEDMEDQERLLSDKDRELFEDILANTISKKIRARIHESNLWVERMNQLMSQMRTSSGLRLNLKWKSKRAEQEEQLDTKELVALLQKDAEIMREEEVEQLSNHFRSKIAEARRLSDKTDTAQSFHGIMREVLDYRKWFEFQLEYQKTGEAKKELTDRAFFTFSGGEKAMSMYVPLFSAAVAKYKGAREDAPRIISLDEAFAGVDEMNIKDMFRLMVDFEFDFIINSQILWGDYETVPALAIYQLVRPENAKYVSVIPYVWNGQERRLVTSEAEKWTEV